MSLTIEILEKKIENDLNTLVLFDWEMHHLIGVLNIDDEDFYYATNDYKMKKDMLVV